MGFFDLFRRGREIGAATWPPPSPKRRVNKITRRVLRMISEASKSTHPHEFAAGMRADGDTITELILMPTESGPVSAHMQLYSLPIDRSIVGTVHSHPGSVPKPSDADLDLFRHFGHTHIIIAEPYTLHNWRAYDHAGRRIEIAVV